VSIFFREPNALAQPRHRDCCQGILAPPLARGMAAVCRGMLALVPPIAVLLLLIADPISPSRRYVHRRVADLHGRRLTRRETPSGPRAGHKSPFPRAPPTDRGFHADAGPWRHVDTLKPFKFHSEGRLSRNGKIWAVCVGAALTTVALIGRASKWRRGASSRSLFAWQYPHRTPADFIEGFRPASLARTAARHNGDPSRIGLDQTSWNIASVGVLDSPFELTQAEKRAFQAAGANRAKALISVARIHRAEFQSFIRSTLAYTAVLMVTSFVGYVVYPYLHNMVRIVDPAMLALDLAEIGQPLGIVITTLAITFGNLLATALGFGFQRLQAIRQSYYEEAAQLGVLTNDLLLLFHDKPNEREAAIRRLLRHGRAIYYTTDKARRDPRNNLDYIYIPGTTSPFDDPLVRIIRQVSTYSGNLRARDAFLERILNRIDEGCRQLSAQRDERISWELSKPPTAMYFSLVSLNALFVLAYIMLTCKLTWEGYQLFFAAMTGACCLLYLVLVDLNSVHGGAFTIHSGLRGKEGTAPILKPTIECMSDFLAEARQECRLNGIPLKMDREF